MRLWKLRIERQGVFRLGGRTGQHVRALHHAGAEQVSGGGIGRDAEERGEGAYGFLVLMRLNTGSPQHVLRNQAGRAVHYRFFEKRNRVGIAMLAESLHTGLIGVALQKKEQQRNHRLSDFDSSARAASRLWRADSSCGSSRSAASNSGMASRKRPSRASTVPRSLCSAASSGRKPNDSRRCAAASSRLPALARSSPHRRSTSPRCRRAASSPGSAASTRRNSSAARSQCRCSARALARLKRALVYFGFAARARVKSNSASSTLPMASSAAPRVLSATG